MSVWSRRPARTVVWWSCAHGQTPDAWPELLEAAEPVTRGRLARLRLPADRATTLLAHSLARMCAAEFLGLGVTGVTVRRRCATCGSSDHGRPEAVAQSGGRRAMLSISHTRSMAIVAVSDAQVGVDAEAAGRVTAWPDIADEALGPDERRLLAERPDRAAELGLALWVRKEALTKLAGSGLATPLTAVDASRVATSDGYLPGPMPGWVYGLSTAHDHVAALAVSRPTQPAIREQPVAALRDRCRGGQP